MSRGGGGKRGGGGGEGEGKLGNNFMTVFPINYLLKSQVEFSHQ